MEMDDDTKVTVLLKALDHTQANYRHLATLSQALFSWIGSVLLAIVGVLALIGPEELSALGIPLRAGLTVAIGSLFLFAWISSVFVFRARVEEGKSAVEIGSLLHFFDATYFGGTKPIFDKEDWSAWTKSWRGRMGITQYTAVLFVLTCVAVAVVWFS